MHKLFSLLLFVGLGLNSLVAKEVDIKPFEKLKMFSDGRLTLERVYEHESIYQIRFSAKTQQGKREFGAYITKDKKMLIVGDGIDLVENKPIRMPLEIDKVIKNADFVYGTGKTKLIVITDPECFYCQAFQQRWPKLKDKYTFYTYLYPLNHHQDATAMSYYVMSQKSDALKAEALIQIAVDASGDRMKMQAIKAGKKGLKFAKKAYERATFSEKQQAKFQKKLEDNLIFGDRFSKRGTTPAVYDMNGDFVIWSMLGGK